MQLKYYGLSDKPFELSPDLKFLFVTSGYRKAFETIQEGIFSRKGLMALTGEVGTGKTMLIYRLIRELPETVKTAFVYHSTGSLKEIIAQIFADLGEAASPDPAGGEDRTLPDYLRRLKARGEILAVLIDEAQDLSPAVLQGFLHFFDDAPETAETLQLVLVGQTEFEEMFKRALADYPTLSAPVRASIPLLSPTESLDYIEHRLNIAGKSSGEIFTPRALSAVTRYAGGIPRLINVACDNALFKGYVDSLEKIDLNTVRKVFQNMEGPGRLSRVRGGDTAGSFLAAFFSRFSFRPAFAVLAVLLLGTAFLFSSRAVSTFWKGPEKLIPAMAVPEASAKAEKKLTPIKGPTGIDPTPSRLLLQPPPSPSRIESAPFLQPSEPPHIRARAGENLSLLVFRHYGKINESLVNLILSFNPSVKNKDLILVDQKIQLPEIKEETLISQGQKEGFVIYLGTFPRRQTAEEFRSQPELQGKFLNVRPIDSDSGKNGYRLDAGIFSSRTEALEVVKSLRRKNLLSFF
jgi:general secretion pathway protein A